MCIINMRNIAVVYNIVYKNGRLYEFMYAYYNIHSERLLATVIMLHIKNYSEEGYVKRGTYTHTVDKHTNISIGFSLLETLIDRVSMLKIALFYSIEFASNFFSPDFQWGKFFKLSTEFNPIMKRFSTFEWLKCGKYASSTYNIHGWIKGILILYEWVCLWFWLLFFSILFSVCCLHCTCICLPAHSFTYSMLIFVCHVALLILFSRDTVRKRVP